MDRLQDAIPVLSNIRDKKNLSNDEVAIINFAMGLVHEKIRRSNKTTSYTQEDVRFVVENLDISADVAKAVLDAGLVAIYDNPVGTLANITGVKKIADETATKIAEGGQVERIHRERCLLMMILERII